MKLKRKLFFAVSIVTILATLLPVGLTAGATEGPDIAPDITTASYRDNRELYMELFKDDPIRLTAAIYAEYHEVTLKEAVRRIELQDVIGDMDAELTVNEVETFAGLWIEHLPEFRVIALFTKDGEKTIQPYLPEELADIVEVRKAETSLDELAAIQTEASATINKLGIPVESNINVYENRVEIYTTDQTQLESALNNAKYQLSDKVNVVIVESLSIDETDIYGGLPLRTCTSGYGIVDGGSTRGITTAGHCDDYQTYDNDDLTYIYGLDSTYYDIQWHTVPAGYSVTNEIQYLQDESRMEITATRSRNNQSIGMCVCKYGRTTHYTVGHIDSKTYQPQGGHTATFIRVNNTYSDNLSGSGDSGGPWFNSGTAYGSHVGATGEGLCDAFYMAINYISGVGVSVLTSP